MARCRPMSWNFKERIACPRIDTCHDPHRAITRSDAGCSARVAAGVLARPRTCAAALRACTGCLCGLQPLDDRELRRRRSARVAEAMRRYRAELAPAFRQALADGPSADALRAVRTAAESRYAALARLPIGEYRIEGASAQALAPHRRISPRRASSTDQAQRYATGYRANAAAGLGIVGGAETRPVLSRVGDAEKRSTRAGGHGGDQGVGPPMSAAGSASC